MRTKYLELAALALFAGATATHASSAGPGYVAYPFAASSGAFLFDSIADKSQLHCSSSQGIKYRWAIDSTTAAGQAMISVVLTAYALHKRLVVSGAANCNVWSDTETVWYLYADG